MDGDAPASPQTSGEVLGVGYSSQRPKATRVVSAKVPIGTKLGHIWANRELLTKLIATEIKVKYKNSALGLLWTLVAPAISLITYWVVFGMVLKSAIPHFVIYLFAGMIFWNFFQTSIQTATGVIVERAGIVKKVSFPREILVLASVGTAVVYMFFQAIVLVIFMLAFQTAPAWSLLPLLPVAFVALLIVAIGFGLILAAVNVYARDMRHLIDIFMTVWFFACPVVYSFWMQIHSRLAAHGLTWLYLLNPVTPIILTAQRVIYAHPEVTLTGGTSPTWVLPPWSPATYLLMDLAVAGVGLVLGYFALVLFRRLEGNFAEEL